MHAQQLSPVLLRHLAPLISDTRDTNPNPSGSRAMWRVSSVLWCHWLITPLSPVIGQCIAMSQDQSGCTADPIDIFYNPSDTTVSVTVTSVDNVSVLVTYVDNVSVLTTQWGCTNVPSTLTFVSVHVLWKMLLSQWISQETQMSHMWKSL